MAIDTLGANALASNSVTTAKIAADAVTSAKIPAGAVVAADVADGSITTAKIADDAVTGAKIENSPSIANGLTLTDGDLVFASGHGISFAADASSSVTGVTNTSEILHDYEEGTFTPLCSFGTPPSAGATQGNGQYTKIGRQVHLHFKFTNINVTGASGDIQIQQIPFVPTADSGDGAVGAFIGNAKGNHINFAASSFLHCIILDNAATAKITECIDNATSDNITASNCTHGTTDFQCTLSFTTAS
tara:strand:- start:223 stop:960 length:738 start_codon:yes stop_codon:yes gene_type:complete